MQSTEILLFCRLVVLEVEEKEEVSGEGLISCDAITQISRQKSLEFIIESVHFIKADNHACFYKLFYSMDTPSYNWWLSNKLFQ